MVVPPGGLHMLEGRSGGKGVPGRWLDGPLVGGVHTVAELPAAGELCGRCLRGLC